MSSDDHWDRGIGFDDLQGPLESVEYPVSNGTLTDRFGECELDLEEETVTVSEVLSRDPSDRTYRSADAVRRAVTRLVVGDAVRREGDADRGTGTPDRSEEDALD